jgi:hypothetical protein
MRNGALRARAVAAAATLAVATATADSHAQAPGYPPPAPGYPPGYVPPQPGYPYGGSTAPAPGYGAPGYGAPGYGAPGYGAPGYGAPGYGAQGMARPTSSGLEIGYLYATAATWGVGTGLWINSEAKICEPSCDPGLVVLAPLVLGAAAPVGVFLTDRFAFAHGMPEGLPSTIATGMWIGAGEALGIASYQHVTADAANEWGFRGLARASFIGATAGGLAGVGLHYLINPAPETNLLLLSSTFWGTSIGAFFGGGASATGANWGRTNDAVWLGGELGYNLGLGSALAASLFWTPSWHQLGWMWGGFGVGTVASLPVYIFYAASDGHDPRRGLIFQGVASTVGLGLGAMLGHPRSSVASLFNAEKVFARADERHPVALTGGGLMPVESGIGVQASGVLW